MTSVNHPLDAVIAAISPVGNDLDAALQVRLDSLTKPPGSLGRLEELAARIGRIQRTVKPMVAHKAVLVFAADHGVARSGVSAYPAEVTPQMVLNFLSGGAAVNVLARHAGARVVVADVGVNFDFPPPPEGPLAHKVAHGTGSITDGPAMSRAQAHQALEAGIRVAQEVIRDGADLVAVGDMGIGNTTPSAALTACFSGRTAREVTGRGTGVDDDGLRRKVEAVERALDVNAPVPTDALGALAGVGGFEIGAIAGAILACARHRVPVLVDGFIATAGALVAHGLCPHAVDYMIAGHASAEPGHRIALDHLGLAPYLELNMRLGEGSGAVLAMHLAEAATRIMEQMATFEGAGVSGQDLP
ncbi:MAG: nicotinate-nucleotide--dimethylbenzimidazole phosphoribosyltransferase [Nitrospirota bacterium]|nr:nicotinate-nucleotide--dimethylbenzimidazole phosphoribosyltransferase [Nitrospirota bacterium]